MTQYFTYLKFINNRDLEKLIEIHLFTYLFYCSIIHFLVSRRNLYLKPCTYNIKEK